MELEIRKESVQCWEAVCRTTVEQEETAEMIVPDACPDIWQVVDGEGKLFLQRKEPQEGKAECTGLLKAAILYQPEGEVVLQAMEVTIPFSLSPDLPGITRRCFLQAQPRVLSVDVHLLNPRKVLVRMSYQLELEGFAPCTLAVPALAEGGEIYGICQKTGRYASEVTVEAREKSFSYQDTLTLPVGQPDVKKLLSANAVCTCSEARVVGNKLVFKGEAVLRVLYLAADDRVVTAEFHAPYSQLMDTGEDCEDAVCSVQLFLTELQCTQEEGEPRALHTELTVQAQAILRRRVELPLLSDLYSTTHNLTCQEDTLSNFVLVDSGEEQMTFRETLETEETAGEILTVRTCLGRTARRQEGEELVLSQEVEAVVLCQGEDGPVCLRKKGNLTFRLPGQGDGDCAFSAELLRKAEAVPAAGGIEVSVPLLFRWTVTKQSSCTAVSGVALGEERDSAERRPSVILRAVRPGDTLWDVAKVCLSTEEAIQQASGLAGEELYPGQVLLIPGKNR